MCPAAHVVKQSLSLSFQDAAWTVRSFSGGVHVLQEGGFRADILEIVHEAPADPAVAGAEHLRETPCITVK